MNTIYSILHFLFICLEVILLFNLMIVVHEVGHFLAARWRGLVVEKFGIWFGKPIWKKTIDGVEYSLGSIPAGGFVALPQMAPMEAMEGDSQLDRKNLPPISTLDKIIVAFAGPLFSMTLAFVFAFIVWGVGRPMAEGEGSTKIGYVKNDSPASKAGLLAGDKILSIEGHSVTSFSKGSASVMWRIVSSESDLIPIEVERAGERLTLNVQPEIETGKFWERKGLRQIKIAPIETARVGKVLPNSPAALAGIEAGDIFTKLKGEKIYSSIPIFQEIKDFPEIPLVLTVLRNGAEFEKTIALAKPIGMDQAMLGVQWDPITSIVHLTPWDQVAVSIETMGNMFSALFSSKSDIGLQHMSGPLGIMRLYYTLFESEHGWKYALWFSVVLNVNLALMNLLPMPVLDGGHITIALIERIRGKEISGKVIGSIQTGCAILLMSFMAYVSFFDVQDYGPGKSKTKAPKTIEFAPPQ